MLRSRWIVVLAHGAMVTALANACGRETIELARSKGGEASDGGPTILPDAPTTVPDAATCASRCASVGGRCALATGTCRECNSNADCPGEGQSSCHPEKHVCVMCSETSECEALRDRWIWLPVPVPTDFPTCETSTSRCTFGCTSPADCPLNVPCDAERGICLFCQNNEQCNGGNAFGERRCRGGMCVLCGEDADCNGTHCLPFFQRCVECYDPSHCGPGRECNFVTHECVPRP